MSNASTAVQTAISLIASAPDEGDEANFWRTVDALPLRPSTAERLLIGVLAATAARLYHQGQTHPDVPLEKCLFGLLDKVRPQ